MEKQQSLREAPTRKERAGSQQTRPRSGKGAASALDSLCQLERSYEWANREIEEAPEADALT
jgi:hypothetical protein